MKWAIVPYLAGVRFCALRTYPLCTYTNLHVLPREFLSDMLFIVKLNLFCILYNCTARTVRGSLENLGDVLETNFDHLQPSSPGSRLGKG